MKSVYQNEVWFRWTVVPFVTLRLFLCARVPENCAFAEKFLGARVLKKVLHIANICHIFCAVDKKERYERDKLTKRLSRS